MIELRICRSSRVIEVLLSAFMKVQGGASRHTRLDLGGNCPQRAICFFLPRPLQCLAVYVSARSFHRPNYFSHLSSRLRSLLYRSRAPRRAPSFVPTRGALPRRA